MNPSTASHRLIKDVLWKLICVTNQSKCHCCGEEMSRETFSVEHKTPWLDSEDPIGLFFDLDNISFSHLSCNARAARRVRDCMTEEVRLQKKRDYNAKVYTTEKRRAQYLRTGR